MGEPAPSNSEPRNRCPKCLALRDLSLHLHELGLYCELLNNLRPAVVRKKGRLSEVGLVKTKTISEWLSLAGQLEKVVLNTYQFQLAHYYCEPVNDLLESNAEHRESLLTPLTRFVFVCNALEECYRFIGPMYEQTFDDDVRNGKRREHARNGSAQAAYILTTSAPLFELPAHYSHLVDNFRRVILYYLEEFPGRVDVPLTESESRDHGLSLVRNIRNHVAHGAFPIVDNPEYSGANSNTKRNLVNLMYQASRVAAINIQMLLSLAAGPFESEAYDQHADDDDYGDFFRKNCTAQYLLSLHIRQDFALNEEAYFQYSRDAV